MAGAADAARGAHREHAGRLDHQELRPAARARRDHHGRGRDAGGAQPHRPAGRRRSAEIRRVYSHPVALAQCERFLREHPEMEAVAAYDTAGSVKMIVGGRPARRGGHRRRRRRPGLGRPDPGGRDRERPPELHPFRRHHPPRSTRRRRPAPAPRPGEPKTSIVFRTAHRPGGLHQALAAFAERGVNLTKIESRPILGRPWEYSFYLDFLGDPADPAIGPGARRAARLGRERAHPGHLPARRDALT